MTVPANMPCKPFLRYHVVEPALGCSGSMISRKERHKLGHWPHQHTAADDGAGQQPRQARRPHRKADHNGRHNRQHALHDSVMRCLAGALRNWACGHALVFNATSVRMEPTCRGPNAAHPTQHLCCTMLG